MRFQITFNLDDRELKDYKVFQREIILEYLLRKELEWFIDAKKIKDFKVKEEGQILI